MARAIVPEFVYPPDGPLMSTNAQAAAIQKTQAKNVFKRSFHLCILNWRAS